MSARQKNDAADAAAICEAVTRPAVRSAPIKSLTQQAARVVHRTSATAYSARAPAARSSACTVLSASSLRAMRKSLAPTREALTIEVDQGIKGEQVVDAVTRIAVRRGAPRTIRVDNGPEFVSKSARPLGLRERRHIGLQPAGEADGQRLRGVVQRPPTRRVPEHALVLVAGRCQGQDRGLAEGLQREPSSHVAWLEDAERIRCRGGSESRR